MLIFNKRSSSSSSPHSNKHLESIPQSAILKQDFIEYNGFHNDEDQIQTKQSNGLSNNSNAMSTSITASSSNNQLADDTIQMEETHDGCVYQVTIKKVYNKNLQNESNKETPAKSNNNIYGTYRPISNSFFSYVNIQDQENSDASNLNSSSPNQNKDGLIYTRVKLRQLKYSTLPKFIEHLTDAETGKLNTNLVHTFLVTYRTFTDTATVLKMLRARYEEVLPASLEMTEDVRVAHLKSIRTILHMWLEDYIEDFNEPPDYTNLNILRNFAQRHLANTEIMHIIQAKHEYYENLVNSSQITNNSRPSSLLSIKINLNDSSPSNSNTNQMQTSFTSQFSLSPSTSSTSQSSASRPLQASTHRRSCSNVVAQSNTNMIAEFIPHNILKKSSSPPPTLNHSKSQTNLAQNSNSKSPILNLISNSLIKKSSSALINSINSGQLLESTFMQIDSQYLAEQLTYIDKCLFPKVCAHLCLGGVWSTRYRKNTATDLNGDVSRNTGASSPTTLSVNSNNSAPVLSDKFASIGAFIDQFNCVSFVVQATVLENVDLKPSERAKIIKKWIEVAIACRGFKNFSSLNAIVQGLNTQCVSRLQKTWNEIPSEYKLQFEELTKMFSEDQNQKEFRSILAKDLEEYAQIFDVNEKVPKLGFTSVTNNLIMKSQLNSELGNNPKYSDINSGINVTLGRKYKENMKKQIKNQFREPLGTIPFLGTFLKDLEYLNAQNPTKNDKGYINVLQKRKEYEIVSQIKLLQQASQLYNIKSNPDFKTWLQKQTVYSEEQNYQLSYLIEPRGDTDGSLSNSSAKDRKSKTSVILLSESTDSILSSILTSNKTPQSAKKNFDHSRHSSYGGNSSCVDSANFKSNSPMILSQATDSSSIKNSTDGYFTIQKSSKSSISSTNTSPNLVVKVIIEFTNPDENLKIDERLVANTVIYKRIFIKDSDRTKDVKKAILEKFFLDPETCDKYSLVQVFNQTNQKELPIGDNCNVYYAAKNVPDMQFVLRRRNNGLNGNANNVNNALNDINNGSPPKSSNNFRSPVLQQANKLAKNFKNRSKTQQIVQSNGLSNKVFDDLPPHYPNNNNK